MKKQKPRTTSKKKRRKKKVRKISLAIIILLILCMVAFVALYLTGKFRVDSIDQAAKSNTAVAYIDYSDSTASKITVTADGRALNTLTKSPTDIPELTGLEFTKVIEGEPLEYDNADAFDYAIAVVNALRKFNIYVREINIDSNNEATAFINNVTILFGTNDGKIEQKVSDLNDFFAQVKDLRGTLHMEEVNDKIGYTFKQEKEVQPETKLAEETTEETTDEGGGDEQVEEYQEEVYYEEWQEPEYQEEVYYEEWQEPVYEEEYYDPNAEWVPEEQLW